jgi:hypothetical protein
MVRRPEQRAVQEAVHFQTFMAAHPFTPLQNVPRNAQIQIDKELGRGGMGVALEGRVSDSTGQERDVVVKEALPGMGSVLRDEANARKAVREAYAATGENAFLADVQGLPVTVVPILQANGTVIQQRVSGLDGLAAIGVKSGTPPLPIFRNGFVGDPQAEIERVAGLVLGLHALH